MNQVNIRNFCIIAHIDHGKSTLADRLLEMTGTIQKRDMQEQILDSNPIERERGITIKLAPVRMVYRIKKQEAGSKEGTNTSDSIIYDSQLFILNLIDTPGHVDFNYEVSRSLAACEGVILVVDATQGVQAQTLANLALARKHKLTIIPVINKIDLPNAQIDLVRRELEHLNFRADEILEISAKTGKNVDQVLNAVIERVPDPHGIPDAPLRALIFSSQYDAHKGVVVYVRVVDGIISVERLASSVQEKLKFMATNTEIVPIEVGYFNPGMKTSDGLKTGEVGYIATGLKEVGLANVGDTVTVVSDKLSVVSGIKHNSQLTTHNLLPLPGYQEPKPMVFLGLFPINSDEYEDVREAMGKLRLSDSAFTYKPISSLALGNGFHCGFLGLLHAEIVQERLNREFSLAILATAPTVEYRIRIKNQELRIRKKVILSETKDLAKRNDSSSPDYSSIKPIQNDNLTVVQSASEFPDPAMIDQSFEPVMEVAIFSPKKYTGNVMQLCQNKRAEFIDMKYISDVSVVLNSFQHLNEIPKSIRQAQDPEFTEGQVRDDDLDSTLVQFTYIMPLSEMIIDFFDNLKSASEGYASLDYQLFDYQPVELVKLDILLNHEKVDAFSQLVVKERAHYLGKMMVDKLKDVLPRQQFAIPVQAAIGGEIIARADVKPFRKDVTQKLYGGDRTRKDKLLEAQKKGKARMKKIGRVEIPLSTFMEVFKNQS